MGNNYEFIGYIGTVILSINLIPQVYHVYKTKNVKWIPLTSIFLNILSSIIMTSYGILIQKIPIVISSIMFFIFYCILGYLKCIFHHPFEQQILVKERFGSEEIVSDESYAVYNIYKDSHNEDNLVKF